MKAREPARPAGCPASPSPERGRGEHRPPPAPARPRLVPATPAAKAPNQATTAAAGRAPMPSLEGLVPRSWDHESQRCFMLSPKLAGRSSAPWGGRLAPREMLRTPLPMLPQTKAAAVPTGSRPHGPFRAAQGTGEGPQCRLTYSTTPARKAGFLPELPPGSLSGPGGEALGSPGPLVLLGAARTTVPGDSTTDPTESHFFLILCKHPSQPHGPAFLAHVWALPGLCQTPWQLQGFPHPVGPCMGPWGHPGLGHPTGPGLRRGGSGCT